MGNTKDTRELLEVIKKQLDSSESFKKRCWQKIIIRKILNQAEVLRLCKRTLLFRRYVIVLHRRTV